MDTKLLYYEDAYLTEFSATLSTIDEEGDSIWVVLDQTAFYPEGGGQPGDQGTIGPARVLDTRKSDHVVRHLLDRSLSPGTYECRVDWEYRFDYMQQHTGQHIVSGCLHRLFDVATEAVHQGHEYTTVETNASEMAPERLTELEDAVNAAIRQGLPVSTEWQDEGELDIANLRRKPKVKGPIRIVSIKDLDRVACGGVHTAKTSEVGLAKLIWTETVRGHLRTVWKLGGRAYADYRTKHETIASLGALLSSPPEEVDARVRSLEEKRQIAEYERRRIELTLTSMVADQFAAKLPPPTIDGKAAAANGTTEDQPRDVRGTILDPLPIDFSELLKSLTKITGLLAIIVIPDESGFRWGIIDTADSGIDHSHIRKSVLDPFGGKGGGRAPLWQGRLPSESDAAAFLSTAKEVLEGRGKSASKRYTG